MNRCGGTQTSSAWHVERMGATGWLRQFLATVEARAGASGGRPIRAMRACGLWGSAWHQCALWWGELRCGASSSAETPPQFSMFDAGASASHKAMCASLRPSRGCGAAFYKGIPPTAESTNFLASMVVGEFRRQTEEARDASERHEELMHSRGRRRRRYGDDEVGGRRLLNDRGRRRRCA